MVSGRRSGGKSRKSYDDEDEGFENDLEDEMDDADFDEAADEDGDDDYEQGKKSKKAGKRKKTTKLVDEFADEEDEEEEEDGRRAKKRSKFIDDIAAVDEDEEEEDDQFDEEDLINDREEDVPDVDYSIPHRHLQEEEEENPEEIARRLEERYGGNKAYAAGDFGDMATETTAVGQQSLLPTIEDPKLWMVHCRPGNERLACLQLLQKYYSMQEKGTPLNITSAVCLDHLKGYIYVEAQKEAHVMDAIRGLRTLFSSKGATLVPLAEMVDAISVNRKAQAELAPDSWVRVKTGLYKDDLAKVVEADYAAGKVDIMLVPRLDYEQMANRDDEARRRFPFGRTPTVRPPAKPFRYEEARSYNLTVTRTEEGHQIGSHRFQDGYTIRTIALRNVIPMDTMPPLEEVANFNAAKQTVEDAYGEQAGASDLSALMEALPGAQKGGVKGKFVKGDKVIAIRGELQNIVGVVQDILPEGRVVVLPRLENIDDLEPVDFDPSELRKHFAIGEHVKVLAGSHKGESGMVVQVQDEICVLMSDIAKTEMKVFAKDLTDFATELPTENDKLGEYSLHDLVMLDANTAGVIVSVDQDVAKVMTTASGVERPDIRVCKLPDIQKQLRIKGGSTQDVYGNSIRDTDLVTIMEGPHKGKQGTVAHIIRGYIFLKSPDVKEHGGFLCIRGRSCRVRGSKQTSISVDGLGSARTPTGFTPQSPGRDVLRSPMHGFNGRNMQSPGGPYGSGAGSGGGSGRGLNSRGGGPGAFSGRSSFARSRDSVVGKTVKVIKGVYNGYKGRVKQETDTHVQVELEAMCRVVTIAKGQYQLQDPAAGAYGQYGGRFGGSPSYRGGFNSGRGYPTPGSAYNGSGYREDRYAGSRTPLHPTATPLHPSMTPLHPSMTPLHPSMTPLHASAVNSTNDDQWGQHSSRHREDMTAPTPNAQEGYGNAYTPAFTPAMTPAFTPADGSGVAPTPGADPGVAPTPGGQGRTPYGEAGTPAATPGDTAFTPGSFEGYTPANTTTPGFGATPGMAAAFSPAFTPGVAMTPDGGYEGATPGFHMGGGGGGGGGLEYTSWVDVLVALPGGDQGVVKHVTDDGVCTVQPVVPDTVTATGYVRKGDEQDFSYVELVLVKPSKKDRVKVLSDEHQGRTGQLIGLDGNDGIVKGDGASGNMMILVMDKLGKLVEEIMEE